jgi:hypothetical protein
MSTVYLLNYLAMLDTFAICIGIALVIGIVIGIAATLLLARMCIRRTNWIGSTLRAVIIGSSNGTPRN